MRLLSYVGRCQLIKSVLFAITSYWMQVFPLPKKVLRHIEAICRPFLLTGKDEVSKRALVAWDKVCAPKSAGGLHILSLVEWNIAAVAKLLWNIHCKADKLWVKWVHMYFLKGQDVMEYQLTASCFRMLRNILKCRTVVVYTRAWADAEFRGKYRTAEIYKDLRGVQEPVSWRKVFCALVMFFVKACY